MRVAFLFCLMLTACSRPLSEGEEAFAADLTGDTLKPAPVRFTRDVPLGVATFAYTKRPRLSCRERILPEPTEEVITTSPAGVVVFNRVYTSKGWSAPDYLPDYPEQLHLTAAMFFAHEMVHIWQWQQRETTGYSLRGAAREHKVEDDPYQFELKSEVGFLDYGYEQQASIVEEYLCCSLLDPDAPRTARLQSLVTEVFPTENLPRPESVLLPWDGVKLQGICS